MAERRRGRRRPAGRRTRNVLDEMRPVELAAVLRVLIGKHPELKTEAEAIAVEMLSPPSIEDVAEEVFDAITVPGVEALHGRAGKQPWGYVEPGEAAWDILQEAMEGPLSDMKRCARLGLRPAAEAICVGIVLGLYRASEKKNPPGLLGWASDFPVEMACDAVSALFQHLPAEEREPVRNRLFEALGRTVGGWWPLIEGASNRPLPGS